MFDEFFEWLNGLNLLPFVIVLVFSVLPSILCGIAMLLFVPIAIFSFSGWMGAFTLWLVSCVVTYIAYRKDINNG